MWAVVEQVINNKLYVIYDNQTRQVIENNSSFVIKENNYINIVDGKIIEIKPYNEELYKKIKILETEILKKNKQK